MVERVCNHITHTIQVGWSGIQYKCEFSAKDILILLGYSLPNEIEESNIDVNLRF